MDDLLAARSQMAMSLAFHILFAVAGMAMPFMMVIAEAAGQRTGDGTYRKLAQHWARGTAILFAVGAVSGTVLSFELGLLWPDFMQWAGPIIGMPFSLEGFAFFAEAVFLGIYLYGWGRVSPRAHLASGVAVAISGVASAFFVVTANAWMNTPAGFVLENGRPVSIDPFAAMLNPSSIPQAIHMILAAYAACGFAVAGIHAWLLLHDRHRLFNRYALQIALLTGGIAAILQPASGERAVCHRARRAAADWRNSQRGGTPHTVRDRDSLRPEPSRFPRRGCRRDRPQ
jgi:cytochrome d ubiquinol oxidase subunit I